MKYLLFTLLIIVTLSSCKNDDYIYSGTYVSKNVEINKIRLFTINGEVTEQTKINDFLIKKPDLLFATNYDSIIDIEGKIRIEYPSGKKAIVSGSEEPETRNVIEKGNYIYYELPIVYTRYNFSTLPFYDNIVKLKPIYSETTPLAPASGFSSKTEFKHCYFVKGKEEIIEMPLISFVYSRYTNAQIQSQEAVWNNNNEFNPKSISHLTSTDTLAIQEFNVILEKQ